MSEPLNPVLHRELVKHFPQVLISNEGEPFVGTRQPSSYRRGRHDNPPLHSGEYYRVSCPFCDDSRQRLYINHMFNVLGEDGDDHLYLAYCFNEQCIDSRFMQKRLLDMIIPFGYRARQRLRGATPRPTVLTQSVENPPPVVRLPPSFSLHDPLAVNAWQYLLNRGFDPQEISERWGVNYCLTSPYSSPRIFQRLVIPIYQYQVNFDAPAAAVLAGWQAREVSPTASGPKYLSMAGMHKSHLLYGLPQAVNSTGPIVIVEGPTDVWRLGSNAVALFGKSISRHQVRLLSCHLAHRPMVVALDRDALDDAHKVLAAIRESRQGWRDQQPVVLGHPPAGAKDFGDATREAAWSAVWAALSQTV